jgi:hypothetical protein
MKKFLSILLLMLPLAGNAQKLDKPEVPTYEGLSPRNVQWELAPYFLFTEAEDLAGLTFFDRNYVAVTKDNMERWVAAAFKKVERTYVAELHDCDDLAWEMLVFLRREAMHTHPRMEHGLLAGMAAIKINTPIPELGITFTGEHAVVLVRVRNAGWWIIEPGTGKGTKLAEEIFDGRVELKGVWF